MTAVHVVLVPGFWLGAWAWDEVLPTLRAAGLRVHPVTLPGLASDDDRSGIDLDDHVGALVELVDGLDGEVVLVAHSGGALPVQTAVDRRPERVRRVVYVDTGPMSDGVVAWPAAPGTVELPFPSEDVLGEQGLSTEGLDATALELLRHRAVPEPAGVAAAPVHLADDRRLQVPVTVVCTSLPAEQLRALLAAGQIPSELPRVHDVEYVDLPTGHWPMLSRPTDLGRVIADAVLR
ncbi:alpha/beta hydrolase [Georgenia sp. 10Sc9-8]|uniref:Alpha/beta hydrolase n=1 Tax=Georgenia halotolerans TaxID=3028317 RepID=A0ABT5U001_9MICO|nr:alpha/beta hydrolase [Georgenia halotolerans]